LKVVNNVATSAGKCMVYAETGKVIRQMEFPIGKR